MLAVLSQPDEADCQAVPLHIYLYKEAESKMEEEKTHHIVYETINLINGKKYIGKHSTKNLNDNYLGSGRALKNAVKKYGKENFKRAILAEFDTEEDAFIYETILVTENTINDNTYYNIVKGGRRGDISVEFKEGLSKNMSSLVKDLWKDPEYRKMKTEELKSRWKNSEFREKMSNSTKQLWKDPKFIEIMHKMHKDDAFLEMQREKGRKQWRDPEMRKILHQAIIDRWKDPKYREKMSESMRRVLDDPEYHKKLSDAQRGEKNPAAKLSESDVMEIKKRLKSGKRGIGVILAKEFDISTSIISSINVGRLWKGIKSK